MIRNIKILLIFIKLETKKEVNYIFHLFNQFMAFINSIY
jgi:hypothetical protein